ncbi:MAG TPA: response regulator, partial [Acidobacteriaceae bacterium]|nr:response regulator [Acidobacteriaceae bacterium]
MRALIVDDEPIARKILREELALLDSIEVVGEAENGEAALVTISSIKPDIVFLDIQLPGMNGFQVLDHLNGGHVPAIVMVTAYDQHAIQAFEKGAVDYLLKPIDPQRLTQAVERAKRVARNPLQAAEILAQLQEIAPAGSTGAQKVRKVVGRLGEELFLLSLDEVVAVQADGNLTWIITSEQRYLATHNLKAIESRLQ